VTVDAMLDATVKLLKKRGTASITTNRVADTAGVSIGSVYQYFPNKRALFAALHERHIKYVDGVIRRRLAECTGSSLEFLVQCLIEGMVETHISDAELSGLLQSEVPHRADGIAGFSARFHEPFCAALAPHARSFRRKADLNTRAFVVAHMVESLGHAIVLGRPRGLSLQQAKKECCSAILAYLTT